MTFSESLGTDISAETPISRRSPVLRPAMHSTALLLAALEQRDREIALLEAQLRREQLQHRRRLARIQSKLEVLAQILERAGIRPQDLSAPPARSARLSVITARRPSNEP